MDLKLKNKKALVLGSSSGIGRAIAEALLSEGADVALAARNEEKLKAAAKELGCKNYFACDLSVKGQAQLVTEKAIKALDGLDILVTNTGGPKRGTFLEISQEQWLHDFQNLWMSVVESLQVALPVMQKSNYGRVLLVTSYAAVDPRPGLTTSNGLRAGLLGLAKSVVDEYAPYGITVNTLMPGLTSTARLLELKLTGERVKQMVPAGRIGEPWEIANLAAFLSSPLAGYITGQAIAVDGGASR